MEMTGTISINRLVPSNAPEYRALMLEAYENHPDAFTSSVAERTALALSWWESRVALGDQATEVVFGAFGGATLAGVAGLSFETRRKARHKATLFGMYVPPRARGLGIGRRLVDTAVAFARSRSGVKVVQLTVTEGNGAAETLYRRCGFVPFGVEPFAVAVGDNYVTKVHMWCDIDPVISRSVA